MSVIRFGAAAAVGILFRVAHNVFEASGARTKNGGNNGGGNNARGAREVAPPFIAQDPLRSSYLDAAELLSRKVRQPGDGACFFHSFNAGRQEIMRKLGRPGEALPPRDEAFAERHKWSSNTNSAAYVRHITVNYIGENSAWFLRNAFGGDRKAFARYLQNMSKRSTWADQSAATAAAMAFGVKLRVWNTWGQQLQIADGEIVMPEIVPAPATPAAAGEGELGQPGPATPASAGEGIRGPATPASAGGEGARAPATPSSVSGSEERERSPPATPQLQVFVYPDPRAEPADKLRAIQTKANHIQPPEAMRTLHPITYNYPYNGIEHEGLIDQHPLIAEAAAQAVTLAQQMHGNGRLTYRQFQRARDEYNLMGINMMLSGQANLGVHFDSISDDRNWTPGINEPSFLANFGSHDGVGRPEGPSFDPINDHIYSAVHLGQFPQIVLPDNYVAGARRRGPNGSDRSNARSNGRTSGLFTMGFPIGFWNLWSSFLICVMTLGFL